MRKILFIFLFIIFSCPATADNLTILGAGGGGGIIPGCPITSQPTNLLTAPNNFSNAAWSENFVTTSQNVAADPCGSGSDAQSITDTSSNVYHGVQQGDISVSAGTNTVSVFVKYNGVGYVVLSLQDPSSADYVYAVLNDQNGTITQTGQTASGTITYVSSSAQSAGNGWWYFKVSGSSSITSYTLQLYMTTSSTPGSDAPFYTGSGTGIYAYQARLSAGAQ